MTVMVALIVLVEILVDHSNHFVPGLQTPLQQVPVTRILHGAMQLQETAYNVVVCNAMHQKETVSIIAMVAHIVLVEILVDHLCHFACALQAHVQRVSVTPILHGAMQLQESAKNV